MLPPSILRHGLKYRIDLMRHAQVVHAKRGDAINAPALGIVLRASCLTGDIAKPTRPKEEQKTDFLEASSRKKKTRIAR